jgi:hypothetical protein
MGLMDGLKSVIRDAVWGGIDDDQRIKYVEKRREYRRGKQAKQLEIKNGADDNITVNFIGLVVDRAVTMLFGKDVEFDLPGEGDSPEQLFIDATWDANKKSIILQKLATLGAESGTPYVKFIPDGIIGRDGNQYTRLIPQDPKNIEIVTKPDDIDYVERYVIRWTGIKNGKEVQYRQTIQRVENAENWEWITEYKNKNGSNWIPESQDSWEYDFPPLMHWQNLADPLSPYGRPDITDDVIVLQDKLNFAASNIGKILRFYAHPVTIFKGVQKTEIAYEPGKGVFIPAEANAFNLETQGDLISSFNFLQFLQSSLFSITQTVDISSFTDKLGALTNFGLRVLYTDALARLDSKHELYGDALREINRRLLVLSGKGTDGGEVVWPDVLPTNETEQTQALEADKRMGIVSNQTVATARGYVWEDEEERIANDRMKENENSDNVGAMLLNNFNRGGITR